MQVDDGARAITEAELDAYLAALRPALLGNILGHMQSCESPIEQRLMAALAFMQFPAWGVGVPLPRLATAGGDLFDDLDYVRGYEFCFVIPQAKVWSYRADFGLIVRLGGQDTLHRAVIECDGHDFHERTKEQAQRDRSRDREMTTAGLRVFRFTGSEIFRDAHRCATEISGWMRTLTEVGG